MKRIVSILTTVIMVFVFVLALNIAGASEPRYGGVLKIITGAAPASFGDPAQVFSFAAVISIQPVFESLLDYHPSGHPRPLLATAWKIAPDKKSITFTLRKGVKFHDGTDFNAEACKWNLERNMKVSRRSVVRDWASVDVIDDYTVRINLKKWKNTQLSNHDVIVMISPTAFEKNGEDWAKMNPVGTGPFKFKNYTREASMEYVRFDDYWGGKPYLDGITYVYIKDSTTALMAFEAGEAQILEESSPSSARDLKNKGYRTAIRRGAMLNLLPDSANPDSVYADKRVREAIEYAIDREQIAKTLGYGFWEAVNQPTAPEQFGHVPDLKGRSYNPEKAKKLLAAAGYPKGFQTKIISGSGGPFNQDALVAIQDYLAKMGIQVKLEVVSFPKWYEYRTKGWKDGLIYSTHGATDINYCEFLERYYSRNNINYPVLAHPPGWDDLVDRALDASDYDSMKALSQEAVKMLVDEAMNVCLWIESAIYVMNDSVQDPGFATHGNAFRWDTGKCWLSK